MGYLDLARKVYMHAISRGLLWAVQAEVSHLPFRWQVRDENLASGLCYTSGTTGNPKVDPPPPITPQVTHHQHA